MKSINYEDLVTKVLNRRNHGTILNMPVLDTTMNWLKLLFMAGEWEYIVLKPSFAVKLNNVLKMAADAEYANMSFNEDLITDDIMDYVQDHHIKNLAKLIKDADNGKRMKPPKDSLECNMQCLASQICKVSEKDAPCSNKHDI